jgi:hypothetical protein
MWRLLRGRGRVCLLWPRSSPSPRVGRGGDRRPRPGLSPSPGSGGVEFVVFRGCARVRALGRAERSSSSSGAVPESEPWVGQSGVRRALGRAERSSSSSGAMLESEPWVGRSGVRRLPGLCPSLSPGSGGAEFVVFRGCARVRALGRAERSFLWRLRPGLAAVSFTLPSGTAGGVAQTALSSLSDRSVRR